MQFSTLDQWLDWMYSSYRQEIRLGLERVRSIAERLDLLALSCPVVIVGGTNGKGSTVASLSAVYQRAGYRVGTFTSPILYRHNEYVRVNGVEAHDSAYCGAYAKIEALRGDILLTPFEYHTLAALMIFQAEQLDVVILEVGLGGRLDAVNIIDADVAVVTSIGLDHTEWLGDTREAIGFEKAGIFRAGRPAVCGDIDPPLSLIKHAEDIGAELFVQGRDYQFHLPQTNLLPQNISTALMVIELLQNKLPVAKTIIDSALATIVLPGRLEVIPGSITEIFDVSHNPDAVNLLAKFLEKNPAQGKTHAVFSMLSDKDILTSVKNIKNQINYWYVAPLKNKRAASAEQLQHVFNEVGVDGMEMFTSISDAYSMAKNTAKMNDRVIIFGSFYTVAAIRKDASHANQSRDFTR